MKNYTADEVLKIAKRHNNSKRSYLLVNPLQGKHLPVSPSVALEMMRTIGDKVAKKYPDCKIVIGFAETATAVGAIVAASLNENCFYVHTTRENFSDAHNFINFLEEHSHAPEQKLFREKFGERINKTSAIIFVDDEISTGKTLLNIIRQMKSEYPALSGKKIIAASIINRLTDENEKIFANENIDCEYLVKLREKNFDVSAFETSAPKILNLPDELPGKIFFDTTNFFLNPRTGVQIGEYINESENSGEKILKLAGNAKSVLVCGTEECMLPAIIAGKILESRGFNVVTHSTTRSPIGICDEKNYPVKEGYQIKSFYDTTRTNYIYNLKYYDLIFIISDVNFWQPESVKSLVAALDVHGFGKIIFIGGKKCSALTNLKT